MAAWESLEEALVVGWGIERAFVCPEGHSSNAHASVNSINGFWYCFSCGARGHADMSRMDVDPHSVLRSLRRAEAMMNPVHETYPEAWLSLFDSLGPGAYWSGRFTPETCQSWRMGQAYDGTCATIPVRNLMGNILGIIRRDLTGRDEIKYRYPSGITMSNHLGGFERATHETLILTEGMTDMIAASEVVDCSPVSCYGANLSWAQVQLIHQYAPNRILCAFDMDEAGHAGFMKIKAKLRGYYPVDRLWWHEYNDLASMPVDLRAEMLHEVTGGEVLTRVVKTG